MFVLGKRSLEELVGVHPHLVDVVQRAIKITPVDFAVHDGLRSMDQQREYVRTGVSKTLNSKHLRQADGYGHAVDLVPYINGRLRWEWEPIYQIAAAVRLAEQNALDDAGPRPDGPRGHWRIVWGGVWDRFLENLDPHNLSSERSAYRERMRLLGKRAFSDGPHFELRKISAATH